MSDSDRKEHKPDPDSWVDKHGFDNVMRGLLAVKPKDTNQSNQKKPLKKAKLS